MRPEAETTPAPSATNQLTLERLLRVGQAGPWNQGRKDPRDKRCAYYWCNTDFHDDSTANNMAFCSEHCQNLERGYDCEPGCPACEDDRNAIEEANDHPRQAQAGPWNAGNNKRDKVCGWCDQKFRDDSTDNDEDCCSEHCHNRYRGDHCDAGCRECRISADETDPDEPRPTLRDAQAGPWNQGRRNPTSFNYDRGDGYYIQVAEHTRDLGEGPWDNLLDAADWLGGEVGVPARVVELRAGRCFRLCPPFEVGAHGIRLDNDAWHREYSRLADERERRQGSLRSAQAGPWSGAVQSRGDYRIQYIKDGKFCGDGPWDFLIDAVDYLDSEIGTAARAVRVVNKRVIPCPPFEVKDCGIRANPKAWDQAYDKLENDRFRREGSLKRSAQSGPWNRDGGEVVLEIEKSTFGQYPEPIPGVVLTVRMSRAEYFDSDNKDFPRPIEMKVWNAARQQGVVSAPAPDNGDGDYLTNQFLTGGRDAGIFIGVTENTRHILDRWQDEALDLEHADEELANGAREAMMTNQIEIQRLARHIGLDRNQQPGVRSGYEHEQRNPTQEGRGAQAGIWDQHQALRSAARNPSPQSDEASPLKLPSVEDLTEANEEKLRLAGEKPALLRDPGSLESAVGRADQHYSYTGDMLQAAAALGHGIGQAQAFTDGNKRTAHWATDTFLRLNGYPHIMNQDDLEYAKHLEGYGEKTHTLDDTIKLFHDRQAAYEQRQSKLATLEEGKKVPSQLRPAIRLSDGEVMTGEPNEHHFDLYDRLVDDWGQEEVDRQIGPRDQVLGSGYSRAGSPLGYADTDGNFYTRDQVRAAHGESQSSLLRLRGVIGQAGPWNAEGNRPIAVLKTEDGYTFYRLASGKVVDNLDPSRVDMSWPSYDEFQDAMNPDGMRVESDPCDQNGDPQVREAQAGPWNQPSEVPEGFDDFLEGYMECALWASTDNRRQCENDNCAHMEDAHSEDGGTCPECGGTEWKDNDDSFHDEGYGFSDFSDEAKKEMTADCQKFWRANGALINEHGEAGTQGHSKSSMAGHQFFLDRNHYASAFKEADYPDEVAERLDKFSDSMGSQESLYLGDDGKLYF